MVSATAKVLLPFTDPFPSLIRSSCLPYFFQNHEVQRFVLSQTWLQVQTKLSRITNTPYVWILKSQVCWSGYNFSASSRFPCHWKKEKSGPFPIAKGAWYHLILNTSFPAWQNFIFHRWQKIGAISVLGYDLQENRSSRSAPDSKSSASNIFSYNCRWYELASYTLDEQHT